MVVLFGQTVLAATAVLSLLRCWGSRQQQRFRPYRLPSELALLAAGTAVMLLPCVRVWYEGCSRRLLEEEGRRRETTAWLAGWHG